MAMTYYSASVETFSSVKKKINDRERKEKQSIELAAFKLMKAAHLRKFVRR